MLIFQQPVRFAPMSSEEMSQRPPSWPFISGDTFRSISDWIIEPDAHSRPVSDLPNLRSSDVVFIAVDVFRRRRNLKAIFSWLDRSNHQIGLGPQLILHNGDIPPSDQIIDELASRGALIYCVNKITSCPYLTPIPIGLENAHHHKNGVVTSYLELTRQTERGQRNIEIFSSFNSSTNPAHRESLSDTILKSRHSLTPPKLQVSEYQEKLRSSMFVASPPGYGLDCHRTWDAIYLGAVPIVLRGTLSPSLISRLPIWEVEDWEKPFNATTLQLQEKFLELKKTPTDAAFMRFWFAQIETRKTFRDFALDSA